jgi:hypothetical protein
MHFPRLTKELATIVNRGITVIHSLTYSFIHLFTAFIHLFIQELFIGNLQCLDTLLTTGEINREQDAERISHGCSVRDMAPSQVKAAFSFTKRL